MTTATRVLCRLCIGGGLRDIVDFGDVHVSNFIEPGGDSPKAPLTLAECEQCGLVQLRHTAPMELMYSGHYWYQSKLNKVIVDDLKEIAEIAMSLMNKGDTILDIGANDGTMLSFIDSGYARIGCEPASNFTEELEKHADYVIADFWSKDKYEYPKAKVVTAIGMFYDCEDPRQFVRDAAAVMTDDGVFIAQLMTLAPMIKTNDLGNICHEHLEYYSYKNLVYLFETSGLEIYKVEENSINGGSYRIFARKLDKGSIEYDEIEFDAEEFASKINDARDKTAGFIRDVVATGHKVYGYGASTKGNTLLQVYGLTPDDLIGVIDPHPEKQGKVCAGSNIPVVGEEHIKEADYLFILPWAFTGAFIEKERARGYKGEFIVSIPEFKVI